MERKDKIHAIKYLISHTRDEFPNGIKKYNFNSEELYCKDMRLLTLASLHHHFHHFQTQYKLTRNNEAI